jgi:shikimate kinase
MSESADAAVTSASDLPFDGHLVLVGLPGSGKSTVGRTVARLLKRPFLDFDTEIERRLGKSVARIFAEDGESLFREREIALTLELSAAPPMVLAPGGGWVTNPGVMALIRPRGRIIHLRISPEAALRRLSRSRVVRPLLTGSDPQATMDRLWAVRESLYAQADLEIDVEVVDSQQVVENIVVLARNLTAGLG